MSPLDPAKTTRLMAWLKSQDKKNGNTDLMDKLQEARQMAGADFILGTEDDKVPQGASMEEKFKNAQEAQQWLNDKSAEFKKATGQSPDAQLDQTAFQEYLQLQDEKNKNTEMTDKFASATKMIKAAEAGQGASSQAGEQKPDEQAQQDGQNPDARGEENGVMSFLGNNKYGLGAALMVGLLATAMGGGGIVGLILGLLAMMLVGGMMGENGLFGGKGDKSKDGGQARSKEGPTPTPGHEQAIDVTEGTDVQVARVNPETKQHEFLVGKDENGLKWGPQPADIELRTLDDKGRVTGFVEGRVEGDHFRVTSSTSMLADGREGPEIPNAKALAEIGRDGQIDMGGGGMKIARQPSATKARELSAPKDVQVKELEDGTARADLGTATITIGDKKLEATVVAIGKLSKDGKSVRLDNAYLEYENKPVTGLDGEVLSVDLPDQMKQQLAVKSGTISPMTGDVNKAVENGQARIDRLKQSIEDKTKADAKETGDLLNGMQQQTNEEGRLQFMQDKYTEKLQSLGASRYEAESMGLKVREMYKNGEFVNKSSEEAAARIAGVIEEDLGETLDKREVHNFARRADVVFNQTKPAGGDAKEAQTEEKTVPQKGTEEPGKSTADAAIREAGATMAALGTTGGQHLQTGTDVASNVGGGGGIRER
ncbi:MAG: hypothetical protein AB7L92_07485 [Alphaproteobacteria bacterium]